MKKISHTIGILTICLVLLCGGMVAALCFSPTTGEVEFIPPPFEKAAVEGVPEVDAALGYSSPYKEGMTYQFSVCGNVQMENKEAVVYLTNPAENAVWMKLRILDEAGNRLGETGLLKPGEYVRTVSLNQVLPAGTPIRLKIMGYVPDSYESAGSVVLNTAIGEK